MRVSFHGIVETLEQSLEGSRFSGEAKTLHVLDKDLCGVMAGFHDRHALDDEVPKMHGAGIRASVHEVSGHIGWD